MLFFFFSFLFCSQMWRTKKKKRKSTFFLSLNAMRSIVRKTRQQRVIVEMRKTTFSFFSPFFCFNTDRINMHDLRRSNLSSLMTLFLTIRFFFSLFSRFFSSTRQRTEKVVEIFFFLLPFCSPLLLQKNIIVVNTTQKRV